MTVKDVTNCKRNVLKLTLTKTYFFSIYNLVSSSYAKNSSTGHPDTLKLKYLQPWQLEISGK